MVQNLKNFLIAFLTGLVVFGTCAVLILHFFYKSDSGNSEQQEEYDDEAVVLQEDDDAKSDNILPSETEDEA